MVETIFWVGKGTSTNCAFVGEAWLAWMFCLLFMTLTNLNKSTKWEINWESQGFTLFFPFEVLVAVDFLGLAGGFFSKTCH